MGEVADAVVLRVGPDGEGAAGERAESGLSVVGVDVRLAGAACPNYGCIRGKRMIRAGSSLAERRRANGFAASADVRPDGASASWWIRKAGNQGFNKLVEKALARFA